MNKNRILQLICLAVFLAAARSAVLYMIEPADYSLFFERILKNKAARHNGHIDMVILGTSRSHRTFDPDVFEREMGLESVFNASSGLQPIQGSYYLLKEMIGRYHPEHVILDVTAGTLTTESATLEKVIVLDRLHGFNKLAYLFSCFSPDEYLNALSRCYRFRNNFTAEKIRDITAEKKALKENGYSERASYPDRYTDSGFIYSYQTGTVENWPIGVDFDWAQSDPDNLKYLEKIIRLCEKNGIRLYLVTTPWSMTQLFSIRNYQDFTDSMKDFAAAHQLSYFNLNYLRDRENWLGDEYMYDNGHVNGEGAARVSEKYARVLDAVINGGPLPDIFYHDIQEMKADILRIIALRADIIISGKSADIHIYSTQADSIKPLYRVLFSADGDSYTPVTDWSGEKNLRLDISGYEERVYILIEAESSTGEPGTSIVYRMPIEN